MNTIESHIAVSPTGKEEECAKLIIDDTTNSFVLSEIAEANQKYTLTLWVRSDAAGSITVHGTSFATTTAWEKHVVRFVSEKTYVLLSFGAVGTYYVYHPQLEIGDKSTDWRLSPDDLATSKDLQEYPNRSEVTSEIGKANDTVLEVVSNQYTSIIEECNIIALNAVEDRVTIDEYGEFKTNVEAQFEVTSDKIDMNFETTSERINTVDTDMQAQFNKYSKHISFTGENGITIGSGNSAITLEIDNDTGIVFKKNGVAFGVWDGVNFHTGNIVIDVNERAQFGNFAFVPRSDKSLMFLKVGG